MTEDHGPKIWALSSLRNQPGWEELERWMWMEFWERLDYKRAVGRVVTQRQSRKSILMFSPWPLEPWDCFDTESSLTSTTTYLCPILAVLQVCDVGNTLLSLLRYLGMPRILDVLECSILIICVQEQHREERLKISWLVFGKVKHQHYLDIRYPIQFFTFLSNVCISQAWGY